MFLIVPLENEKPKSVPNISLSSIGTFCRHQLVVSVITALGRFQKSRCIMLWSHETKDLFSKPRLKTNNSWTLDLNPQPLRIQDHFLIQLL